MKALIGTVVIVGCIVGVAMWALVARYRADLESVREIDACALDEVACASTPSGLVHQATFAATDVQGDSPSAGLIVSCVRSLWDVGVAFGKYLPPGHYSVRWESFVFPSSQSTSGDWLASGGFLSSVEPSAFVDAALRPAPLPRELAMAVLGIDPVVVFSVTGSDIEVLLAFDARRVRAVVRAIGVGCARGQAADG